MNKICPSHPEKTRLFAEHLKSLADFSYRTEENRGNKLEKQCGALLTSITILSVALVSPAPALFSYFGDGTASLTCLQVMLGWMYLIVLAPLLIALLILLTCFRLRKMSLLASPSKQAEFVKDEYERLCKESLERECNGVSISELDIAVNYCKALDNTFNGLQEKHNHIDSRLKLVTGLLFSSCLFVIIFGLFILVCLCFL